MKIIKRNKQEVEFDISKIINAITKANEAAKETDRMTPKQITRIAERVTNECENMNRALSVEEIQDLVEKHRTSSRSRSWLTVHMKLLSSM